MAKQKRIIITFFSKQLLFFKATPFFLWSHSTKVKGGVRFSALNSNEFELSAGRLLSSSLYTVEDCYPALRF